MAYAIEHSSLQLLSVPILLTGFLSLLVASYTIPYLLSPIRQFPGPFWAQFTNWWRLLNVPHTPLLQIAQHRLHGHVVRWGPNHLSISDPALIKTIYNVRGSFVKSELYTNNDALEKGVRIQNIFGTRSNEFHRRFVRVLKPLYSMTSVLQVEGLADRTTEFFCRRLEEEFIDGENAGRVCNFSDWIASYAWDVDGEVTFNQRFGFLDAGSDIDGWMKNSEAAMNYFGTVGQIPALDHWLAKNPIVRIGGGSTNWAVKYCADRLIARYKEYAQKEKDGEEAAQSHSDFLDNFIDLKAQYPDVVDDFAVVSFMILNVLAGADTTAITLRAAMYFLLKHPSTYQRLVKELDSAQLPNGSIPHARTSELPYLNAVLREAIRLHPAVSMMLERVVPPEGLKLSDGRVIPAGTVVGINPWVVNRDFAVFGDDADSFRPERWLQDEDEGREEFEVRLKGMKAADFSFGAGNRGCIGRNLAIMEMRKVLSTLLLRYQWSLVDPDEEWTVTCKWLAFQGPINVRLTRR